MARSVHEKGSALVAGRPAAGICDLPDCKAQQQDPAGGQRHHHGVRCRQGRIQRLHPHQRPRAANDHHPAEPAGGRTRGEDSHRGGVPGEGRRRHPDPQQRQPGPADPELRGRTGREGEHPAQHADPDGAAEAGRTPERAGIRHAGGTPQARLRAAESPL